MSRRHLVTLLCVLFTPQNDDKQRPPPAWALYGLNAIMVGAACVGLSLTKQLVVPRNFRPPEANANMPAWYSEKYRLSQMWQNAVREVMRDSGTLLASCFAWWGVQVRRGGQGPQGRRFHCLHACSIGCEHYVSPISSATDPDICTTAVQLPGPG